MSKEVGAGGRFDIFLDSVLIKLEPGVILKLFINFSDSQPEVFCTLYSYKEVYSSKDFPMLLRNMR